MRLALAGGFASLVCAVGCTGGSSSTAPSTASTLAPSSSAPTTTSQTSAAPGATPLLTDDALRAAVQGNYEVLVVRVAKAESTGADTRSELTRYTLEILEAPRGSSTGVIQLSQNGAARLATGKSYAITTRDGNPMWGTKGVRESIEIPAGQEKAAAQSHREKLAALAAP